MVRILSIDGGGIRGIIPAIVLAEIEARTGKPVAQLFELIAGTSTGGILAVSLTTPGPAGGPKYAATQMVELYEQQGPRIFDCPFWHRIESLDNLAHARYPCRGIEGALHDYLGEDARLKDALTDILVTAYDTDSRMPFFYRSSRARQDPAYDWPARHVAQATAAAPTYFEPFHERGAGGDYSLLDGGVFATNPAMCALAEVLADPQRALTDVLMISLGTGQLTKRYPYKQVKGWGVVQWAQPLIDILLDGVAETVDYQMRQLLPGRYYRLTGELTEASDSMDDASAGNLAALKDLARQIVRDHDAEIADLCRRLTTAPQADGSHA